MAAGIPLYSHDGLFGILLYLGRGSKRVDCDTLPDVLSFVVSPCECVLPGCPNTGGAEVALSFQHCFAA